MGAQVDHPDPLWVIRYMFRGDCSLPLSFPKVGMVLVGRHVLPPPNLVMGRRSLCIGSNRDIVLLLLLYYYYYYNQVGGLNLLRDTAQYYTVDVTRDTFSPPMFHSSCFSLIQYLVAVTFYTDRMFLIVIHVSCIMYIYGVCTLRAYRSNPGPYHFWSLLTSKLFTWMYSSRVNKFYFREAEFNVDKLLLQRLPPV